MNKNGSSALDIAYWGAILGTLLVVANMLWCSYLGNCLIDDKRHTHGEPFFSFLIK
jgi:hypothetical protein